MSEADSDVIMNLVDSDVPVEHGDAGISKAVSGYNPQAVQTPRGDVRRGRTLHSSHAVNLGESIPRASRSVEIQHSEVNHEYTLFAED